MSAAYTSAPGAAEPTDPMFTSELTGQLVPNWLRFHFLIRVALLLQVSATVALAWGTPISVTARLVVLGGPPAHWAMCALTLAALCGWLDVLVNDLLPAHFALPCVQRNRHIGYMLLGGIYLMQCYAGLSVMPTGAYILLANYAAQGLMCGAYALAATLRYTHAL